MRKINIQELLKTRKKMKPQELLNKVTQNRNMLIASLLGILIILYLDFSFGLKPQKRAISEVNPQIVQAGRKLEQLNLDSIRMQRQASGAKPIQLKEVVSYDKVAWVIEEISRMANEQEVTLSQIKPTREEPAGARDNKKTSQKDGHQPVLIDLEATSGYHQLGRFLAELENYPVLLEVAKLDIKHMDTLKLEHKVRLQLRTYVSEK